MKKVKNGAPLFSEELYFYTNRNNLLSFLASGFILPEKLNNKYYRDISSGDNFLMLFRKRISYDFVRSVSESEYSFPVCIIVDMPAGYSEKISYIMPDGEISVDEYGQFPENSAGLILPGFLPVAHIKEVVFHNERDYNEFSSRKFDDISCDSFNFIVNDKYFDGQYFPVKEKIAAGQISISPERYENISGITATLAIIKYFADLYPEKYFAYLAAYYSLYFDVFSGKSLNKITALMSELPQLNTGKEILNDWIIYLPLFLTDESPVLIKGFGRIIKQISKENDIKGKELFSLLTVFTAVRTIKALGKDNSDYSEYLNRFTSLLKREIAGNKTLDSNYRIFSETVFSQSADFLDSVISFRGLGEWPDEFYNVKLFLLFLKMFTFENIYDFRNEINDYGIPLTDYIKVLLFSAVWSGLPALPGKFKSGLFAKTNAFDSLLNYLLNAKIIKSNPLKLSHSVKTAETDYYEQKTITITGFFGDTLTCELKDYYLNIKDVILKGPKPDDFEPLLNLAKISGNDNLVSYFANTPEEGFVKHFRANNNVIMQSSRPITVERKLDYEKFCECIKGWKNSFIRNIPLDIKKSVINSFVKKTKPD